MSFSGVFQCHISFFDPVVNKINFFISKIIFLGLIKRYPLDFAVFNLMFDPVLNTCEFSTIFKPLKAIHIVEIVPEIMSFVDMLKKVKSFSLKSGLVSTTNITTIVSFVLNFLFGVSLLSELVNNDSCNDIGEKDLEKAPVN
jgi:hypothetical protein